jgi:putative ABC transport system permease protein
MDIEDHILNLVTKKLANEASEKNLDELNELLQQNPEIHDAVKLIFEWWHNDQEQKTEYNSYSLFKKVLEQIKGGDRASKSVKN